MGRVAGVLASLLVSLVLHAAPAGATGTTNVRVTITPSPNTTLGLQIFANANLLGSSSTPTGTMTFKAYGPDDATCSTVIFTSTVVVNGTSMNSARFTPTHAGTYRWVTVYSGDATYAPAGPTLCNVADVIVGKNTIVLTATAAPPVPPTVHGTATLIGGTRPTGSVTLVLTGPDDTFCATSPVYSATVAVNGNGTYDSGPFTPTRSGKYTWRALYSGDSDNLGAGVTACLAAGASQTVTVAPTTVTQKVPYSVWAQPATTALDGIGAWIDTVNDPTTSAGQVAPQYLYGHSFRFAGSAASAVVGLATGPAGESAVLSVVGPDGVAYNTGIGFNWSPNHLYYLFVYGVAPGVWSAWVHDYSSVAWTPIGSLTLPTAWGKLSAVSTTTAAWYGAPATQCAAYPRADVAFSPPVGYVGSTATVANLAGTATSAGDCQAETSVQFGVWAGYHLGA